MKEREPWDSNPTKSNGVNGTRRLQLLTESRKKTRRRCQREEQIRYQDGYQPISNSDALRFGSLLHVGLEAWWKAPRGSDRFAAALAAMRSAATPETDPFELVDAEELMRGYDAMWGDSPLEALAVEEEFRTALVNPETGSASKTFELAGKIDVVARDTGRDVLVEHKSSGEDISQGSPYWARLRMDGQISGYFRGAEALGYRPEACIYDVIGKISLKPYKATPTDKRKYKATGELYANQRDKDETPEEYRVRVNEKICENPDAHYQRGTVIRLEEEMRAYDLETWQEATQLRESMRLGIAPRNPENCVRFGSVCGFFDVCSGSASLDDAERFKKLEWVYPELSADAR